MQPRFEYVESGGVDRVQPVFVAGADWRRFAVAIVMALVVLVS